MESLPDDGEKLRKNSAAIQCELARRGESIHDNSNAPDEPMIHENSTKGKFASPSAPVHSGQDIRFDYAQLRTRGTHGSGSPVSSHQFGLSEVLIEKNIDVMHVTSILASLELPKEDRGAGEGGGTQRTLTNSPVCSSSLEANPHGDSANSLGDSAQNRSGTVTDSDFGMTDKKPQFLSGSSVETPKNPEKPETSMFITDSSSAVISLKHSAGSRISDPSRVWSVYK